MAQGNYRKADPGRTVACASDSFAGGKHFMKFKLAAGALVLGVIGTLALCLLLNRQPEVEESPENKQNSIGCVRDPEAAEGLDAVIEGRAKGKRKRPESAAVPVEATNGDDGETWRIDLERRRSANQQERIELEQMQRAITRLEAEVQKDGRDAKGKRLSGARLQKGRQRVMHQQVQMFGRTNDAPATSLSDGGVEQPKTSPSDDDNSIASTTSQVSIPVPINPKPGMIFKGYHVGRGTRLADLEKNPTVKMTVVTDDRFTYADFKDVEISQGVWEGFLKCKRSANCTFLVQQAGPGATYNIFVNGKLIIAGAGQNSVTADLKAGFNHFKIIGQDAGRFPIRIALKATESTREPKFVTPKDMFYDEKPEEGDVF